MIDQMLQDNKADNMRQPQSLRNNSRSRERQEKVLTEMPHKLHATYYSSLPSVGTLASQPNINIEDCENQMQSNKQFQGYDRNNMTHGTAGHNDTTVNVSQVNPMDNTYYTNHQHGDASFLNNNLNSSNYNTIGGPNGQQPSPTRMSGTGTFMGYVNAN